MMKCSPRAAFVFCLVLLSTRIGPKGQGADHAYEILFGYDQNEGNSETIGFRVGAAHKRVRDGMSELHSKAAYAYGEAEGEKNVNRGDASSEYNRHISTRLYLNIRGEALFDDPAEIQYRVILGPPSVGYYFIKTDKRSLNGEFGLAYMWEEVDRVRDDAPLLRINQEFEQHFSKDARFWQSFEYLPQLDAFDRYLFNTVLGIESGLTEMLFLRFVIRDRYDSHPGENLKNNDLSMNASLAVKF